MMEWVHDFEPKKIRVAAELARRRVADTPDMPTSWLTLANVLTNRANWMQQLPVYAIRRAVAPFREITV